MFEKIKTTHPVPTRAWLLIDFLWILYFLNYCDRQVVYAIFSPVLRAGLGLQTQLGLTGSLFIWATGVTSPFVGKLSERYSLQGMAYSTGEQPLGRPFWRAPQLASANLRVQGRPLPRGSALDRCRVSTLHHEV